MPEEKNVEENSTIIKLNPLFYPLDVIYSASYALLEKAYFSFDGDPNKEVHVNIIPKEGYDLKEVSLEFNNELINYLEYRTNYERNKDIRHVILQKALETNNAPSTTDDIEDELETESLEEDLFDSEDIDDIAIPWDEKYGEGGEKSAEGKEHNNEKETSQNSEDNDSDDIDDIAIPWDEEFGEEEEDRGKKPAHFRGNQESHNEEEQSQKKEQSIKSADSQTNDEGKTNDTEKTDNSE